jgi:hypothetical protein
VSAKHEKSAPMLNDSEVLPYHTSSKNASERASRRGSPE